MGKLKVVFVEEREIIDFEDFICKKCGEDLVNKDYKINIMNFILAIGSMGIGIILGMLIWSNFR